jgi:hypothetical protein
LLNMRRVPGSLCVLSALVVACHEPVGVAGTDTTADTSATVVIPADLKVLSAGDSIRLAIADTSRFGIRVEPGDTLDIGIFAVANEQFNVGVTALNGVLPVSDALRQEYPTPVHTYTALRATGPGTAAFGIKQLYKCDARTSLTPCAKFVWVKVRRSAPLAVVSSAKTASTYPITHPSWTLRYDAREDGTVVDTLYIRNVGSGSFAFGVESASWLAFDPAAETATGPSPLRSTDHPVVIRSQPMAPGVYWDSLRITGIPTNQWNLAVRLFPLRVRVSERSASVTHIDRRISQYAVDASDVLWGATFDTLVRFDPETHRSTIVRALPLPSVGSRMWSGPNGWLYIPLRIPGVGTWQLWRLKDAAQELAVSNLESWDLEVLPDGSVYSLTATALWHRAPGADAPVLVRSFSAATQAHGLLFNPADSSLYYRSGLSIVRRNLRDQSEAEIRRLSPPVEVTVNGAGNVAGESTAQGPIAVDPAGRVYVRVLGEHLMVLDSAGRLLDRRWPTPGVTGSGVVYRNRLIGPAQDRYAQPMVWELPVRESSAPPGRD